MMLHRNKSKQKGVALITVLLIVAIVTVVASDMALRLQMQIQRSQNLSANEQAYWYAMGAESYVKLLLKESVEANDGVISLDQAWAIKNMVFPVEEGQISGEVQDLQSCFNINALYKKKVTNAQDQQAEADEEIDENTNNNRVSNSNRAQVGGNENETADQFKMEVKDQFLALLEAIGVETYEAEKIRDGLIDWLDPDSVALTYGAEDYVYEARVNPHITANSPMVDESELRIIEGMTADIMQKISKHICIIPAHLDMVLNVNTVTAENAEVLHAMLAPKLSLQAARDIISSRPEAGYKDIEDFWQSGELRSLTNISPSLKAQFSVESQYFRMITKTEFNRSWFDMKTSFKVDQAGKVQVIAREFGV
ncbi:type II secretion system minor pseudopilin GspK [Catenovulum sp. SM1970]|uniref:type II secretion system minor pseudopilin GspK n=1 Tax=Marinifaba aquimaris TaxID=2741323 RepID=UPI0015747308|nr:type II secretion system minor pseudopilin GspK [Marinifaba aquimaris]NTS75842.1 type II secretion system minor pseudopilin GspK [Marinifaba aquimaris]